MVTTYIVILCLSAALAGWAAVRLMRRFGPMAGFRPRAGLATLLPAVGFLTVAGAPASVLVGALVLGLLFLLLPERPVNIALVLLAASLLVMAGLKGPVAAYAAHVPPMALYAAVAVLAYGLAGAAWFAAPKGVALPCGLLASLLPLAVAPLFEPAKASLAYDALILASAVLGVLLAGGRHFAFGAGSRMALGLLLAYLQLAALWQGAWIAALASFALWVATLGWSFAEQPEATV